MKKDLTSQYRDLQFVTEAKFNTWLKKTTKNIIHLEDNGQDLLTIHVDSRGEILHCNLQGSVWNGNLILPSSMKAGRNLIMHGQHFEKKWNEMDFVVKSVEKL